MADHGSPMDIDDPIDDELDEDQANNNDHWNVTTGSIARPATGSQPKNPKKPEPTSITGRMWTLRSPSSDDVKSLFPNLQSYWNLAKSDDQYVRLFAKSDMANAQLAFYASEFSKDDQKGTVKEMFVSKTCAEVILQNQYNQQGRNASEFGIIFRTAQGHPAFAVETGVSKPGGSRPTRGRAPPKGSASTTATSGILARSWGTFFENGVSIKGSFAHGRALDPKVKIMLGPTGNLHGLGIDAATFGDMVTGLKTSQAVKIGNASQANAAGYVLMGLDPLNCYETWIDKAQLADYLSASGRPERPKPTAAMGVKMATRLDGLDFSVSHATEPDGVAKKQRLQGTARSSANPPRGDDFPLHVNLNYEKQLAAKQMRTKDEDVLDQFQVMKNTSASTLAADIGWRPSDEKIPGFRGPRTHVDWAQTGQSPAEWLHKSAFSWGGLKDDGQKLYRSSQVPGNLVFGTSETNSVMIRTETAWQELFQMASEIADAQPVGKRKADIDSVKGTLDVRAASSEELGNYMARSASGDSLAVKQPLVPPTDVAKQTSWLWYSFHYDLNTQFQIVSGLDRTFTTQFYPFQRLFYLKAEQGLDAAIRTKLKEKALAKITTIPGAGVVHKPDIHRAFISRPIAQSGVDVFNTSALTRALLESSNEPPVTVENGLGRSFVSSTAPQNMDHAHVWEAALRHNVVNIHGVEVRNPAFATIDSEGHQAQISAASLASPQPGVTIARIPPASAIRRLTVVPRGQESSSLATVHGVPGGSQFDNRMLQENPIQAVPPGFVLTGDIHLFGLLPAKLYSFQGTASDGGVHEIVTISDPLVIGTLFPSTINGDFGSLRFENVQFTYNDGTTVTGQGPGTWFEGDVSFEGPLQPIADVLKNVFHQSVPKLRVAYFVGANNDWTTLAMMEDFRISGTLDDISVTLGNVVKFTSLTVQIDVNTITTAAPYSKNKRMSYGLVGTALLTVPGSVVPLTIDFRMGLDGHLVLFDLTLQDKAWDDAFGIPGLSLSSMEFSTNFDYLIPVKTIGFELGAMLAGDSVTINLSGYYNQGDWGLMASISDLSVDGFLDAFWDVFGGQITQFDNDIEFSTVSLTIDPTGISLEGVVSVDNYQAGDASVSVDRDGFSIAGSITEAKFGDLTFKNPSLDVFIPTGITKAAMKPLQVAIKGTVDFKNLEIDASVYLGREDDGSLVWTIYGEYNIALSSGTLAPELHGSFLDVPMRSVALMAGNTNTGAPGFMNKYGYPLVKGVQLAAQIGSIPALNKVTGVNLDGLTLSVALIDGSGLSMDIQLPTNQAIRFSPTVTSGPISVSVQIVKPPTLTISAGLNVIVPGQSNPLVFTMALEATVNSASGSAQMDGYWVSPFGISPKVEIGPTLAMQLGVNFLPPSLQIGVTGGIMIGSTSATASLSLGDDPAQEMISASLSGLSCNDLIAFASNVAQKQLPPVNPNIFNFETVAFSISTGVQVGTVYTPPGASLAGTVILFGEKATVSASVGKEIQFSGTFDAFRLGPLAVTGAKGPSPTLAFELGPTTQKLLIDGAAKLLELDGSLHVETELLPSPAFEFDMGLAFTPELTFTLHGQMLGALDIADCSKLDFQLDAKLEQHILDWMMTEANTQFVAAGKAADEGFESAKAKLDQVSAAYTTALDTATANLAKAQAAWEAKSKRANDALQQVEQSTAAQQTSLKNKADTATAAYNQKIDAAMKFLDQTKVNAANADQAAQTAAQTSTSNQNAIVAKNQTAYDSQVASMNSKFGNAQQAVAQKQQDVQNSQNALNDCDQRLAQAEQNAKTGNWANQLKWKAEVKAIQSEQIGKKAALATAQGALSAAQSILNGLGYNAAVAALQTYKNALDESAAARDAAVAAGKQAVASTANIQQGLINSAQAALTAAQTTSVEALAAQAAQKAVQDFAATAHAATAAAQAAVNQLSQSAEGVAFAAATTALAAAKANHTGLDIANHAMQLAQSAETTALGLTQWMVNHAGNFVNIQLVELSGTLKGLVGAGQPMLAHVKGLIASSPFDYTLPYTLGKTPDLIKALFEKIWADLGKGVIKLPTK